MRNLLPRTVHTGFRDEQPTHRIDMPAFYFGPGVWGMMGNASDVAPPRDPNSKDAHPSASDA